MPTPEIRTGKQAWTIIEIDMGRVLRFTSSPQPLAITSSQGFVYYYAPGLDDIPAKFGPGMGGGVSANITSQPGGDETWAKLQARGHLLERAGVTVRRWIVGSKLEEADVIIVGKASKPFWGNRFEPISFGIGRRRREAGILPPSGQTIGPDTWPKTPGFVLDPAAVGASYPWIWGRIPTGTLPAYLVEFDGADLANGRLMFAGSFVEATSVEVFDEGVSIGVATVEPKQDLLGVWTSTVTFATLTAAPQFDRAYRVALNQGGGGWAVGAGEEAPWGAGDIMEELLRRHGDFEIDWPRFAGARQLLNAYLLGISVPSQTETWTIVQAILAILPVDWVQGPQGGYPQVRVMSGTSVDLSGTIDSTVVTGQTSRTSRMSSAGATIFNGFTIRYGLAGPQQRTQSVLFTNAGTDYSGAIDLSDSRLTPSFWCAISESIHGPLPKAPVTTELIHDAATAGLWLRDQVLHHALPRGVYRLRGDTTLDRFDSDDVISAVCTDINVNGEPASIRGKVAHDDGTLEVQLMVLEPLALREQPA